MVDERQHNYPAVEISQKNYSEKWIGTNNCDCKNVFTKPGGWASMSMANALAY